MHLILCDCCRQMYVFREGLRCSDGIRNGGSLRGHECHVHPELMPHRPINCLSSTCGRPCPSQSAGATHRTKTEKAAASNMEMHQGSKEALIGILCGLVRGNRAIRARVNRFFSIRCEWGWFRDSTISLAVPSTSWRVYRQRHFTRATH